MRKEKEILRYRMKYGHGGVYCKVCGQPTDNLTLRCERCMSSLFQGEQLEYARRWLKAHPDEPIEVARDAKKKRHLVLFRLPKAAWCGEPVTQQRDTRRKVGPGLKFVAPVPGEEDLDLRQWLCPDCVQIYEELTQ